MNFCTRLISFTTQMGFGMVSVVLSLCAHSLLLTFYYCQWPMKPVGYHLNKHRNRSNSNFGRFSHKSSFSSGDKNQWVTTLQSCPDQQSYCSFTCCQKAECKYSTTDSISLKMTWNTQEKQTKQPPQTKNPKTLGRYCIKKSSAAVTETEENSSWWKWLSLPKN